MELFGLLLLTCLIPIAYAARFSSDIWLLELEIPKESNVLLNLVKVPAVILHKPKNIFQSYRRSLEDNMAMVEEGQGSVKSEQVTYPPDYFQSKLKRLLYLKQKKKEEEADIDLNA